MKTICLAYCAAWKISTLPLNQSHTGYMTVNKQNSWSLGANFYGKEEVKSEIAKSAWLWNVNIVLISWALLSVLAANLFSSLLSVFKGESLLLKWFLSWHVCYYSSGEDEKHGGSTFKYGRVDQGKHGRYDAIMQNVQTTSNVGTCSLLTIFITR